MIDGRNANLNIISGKLNIANEVPAINDITV